MNTTLFDLSGQTALVTVASRAIGKALALGVAQASADIVLISRKQKDLDNIQRYALRTNYLSRDLQGQRGQGYKQISSVAIRASLLRRAILPS